MDQGLFSREVFKLIKLGPPCLLETNGNTFKHRHDGRVWTEFKINSEFILGDVENEP